MALKIDLPKAKRAAGAENLGFLGITRCKTEDSGFDLPGTTNWPPPCFLEI